MKVIMRLLMAAIILSILVAVIESSPRVISEETIEREVVVVDEYYKKSWTQPVWNGKSFTYIHHHERCEITVYYNGDRYTIDDKDTYNLFKDKIGETANATFQVKTYENGKVKWNVIELTERS